MPKFGTWENAENDVPYTVYFDKARKNRGAGGKMINPNDPQENPEMFGNINPTPLAQTKPEEPIRRGAVRPTPSREDGLLSDSRGRNDNMGQNYGGRGQRPARAARTSAGSEQSFERSPLHPHYQAKVIGRGNGSPAWEGRNGDSSQANPIKTRLRPVRGDESVRFFCIRYLVLCCCFLCGSCRI